MSELGGGINPEQKALMGNNYKGILNRKTGKPENRKI
jgi:hypothetical protein